MSVCHAVFYCLARPLKNGGKQIFFVGLIGHTEIPIDHLKEFDRTSAMRLHSAQLKCLKLGSSDRTASSTDINKFFQNTATFCEEDKIYCRE